MDSQNLTHYKDLITTLPPRSGDANGVDSEYLDEEGVGRTDEVADVVLEERQEDRDGLLRLHLEHEAPIIPEGRQGKSEKDRAEETDHSLT